MLVAQRAHGRRQARRLARRRVFRASTPGRGYRVRVGGDAAGRARARRTARRRRARASTARSSRRRATATCARATGRSWRSTCACPPARARTRRWSSTPATATPTRPAARARSPQIAQPARLRGRRRQHARHGLLGRRVRLLRAAAGPRRLRRDRDRRAPAVGAARQGRDDGLSYGGISQLFVAARRPPSLAAITPLSVIDDTATTLYPGGILNTGFALSWAKDRVHDARPASRDAAASAWALERIRAGDKTLQGQPGAAPRGRRPARQDPAPTATTSRASPTRSRR